MTGATAAKHIVRRSEGRQTSCLFIPWIRGIIKYRRCLSSCVVGHTNNEPVCNLLQGFFREKKEETRQVKLSCRENIAFSCTDKQKGERDHHNYPILATFGQCKVFPPHDCKSMKDRPRIPFQPPALFCCRRTLAHFTPRQSKVEMGAIMINKTPEREGGGTSFD